MGDAIKGGLLALVIIAAVMAMASGTGLLR